MLDDDDGELVMMYCLAFVERYRTCRRPSQLTGSKATFSLCARRFNASSGLTVIRASDK